MTDNEVSSYTDFILEATHYTRQSKRSHYLMDVINNYNYEFIENNVIGANQLVDLNEWKSNIEYKCDFIEQILFDNIKRALNEKQYQKVTFLIQQHEKNTKSQNIIDPYIEFIKIQAIYLFWMDNINFSSILNDGLSVDDDIDYHADGNNHNLLSLINAANHNLVDSDVKFGTLSQPINITSILEKISKLILSLDNIKYQEVLSALYLLSGKLLLMKNEKAYAVDKLTRALKHNPYNWEAYEEITKTITDANEIVILNEHLVKEVRPTVLTEFFQIKCWDEFFESINVELYINLLTSALHIFPTSKYLLTKNADLAYKLNDLPQSEFLYGQLVERYPFCLDTMFYLSNILYVTGDYSKLKELVISAKSINEMSCAYQAIHGNLESLIRNGEKAIIHFRTAIKLAKTDFAKKCKLYVLIGHEFVELGNYHAAIFAYRNAIKQDPKDYAAWMGLGFAYDILDQPKFAIYYYQKCISLKNEDPRGWKSIASSYVKADKLELAYNALEKAYNFSDRRSSKMAVVEEILNVLKKMNHLEHQIEWLKVIISYPEADEHCLKAMKLLVELYRSVGRNAEAEQLELLKYGHTSI